MKSSIALILVIILIESVAVQAKVNAKLQSYFENEILKINNSVVLTEPSQPVIYGNNNNDEMYFLNRFRLMLRPAVGIELDGFAQFLVQPEIELLFLRYPAPGWVPYQPR